MIISSFGISNVSSIKNNGTFICEKKGLYIILVTVMICSINDSRFAIHRNNRPFMDSFVGRSDGSSENCNSATGTGVIELHVGDDVNVINVNSDGNLYEDWSSFSAFRLN